MMNFLRFNSLTWTLFKGFFSTSLKAHKKSKKIYRPHFSTTWILWLSIFLAWGCAHEPSPPITELQKVSNVLRRIPFLHEQFDKIAIKPTPVQKHSTPIQFSWINTDQKNDETWLEVYAESADLLGLKIASLGFFNGGYEIKIITKSRGLKCSEQDSIQNFKFLHRIRIPKSSLPSQDFQQTKISEVINAEACFKSGRVEGEPIPFKVFAKDEAMNALNDPRFFVFQSIWGEWEMFQKTHCKDCAISLPVGYPKEKILVGVVDEASFLPEVPRLQELNVDAVTRTPSGQLALSLKRTVEICESASLSAKKNTGFIAVVLERELLKNADLQAGILWVEPFVPEDQVVCRNL